MLALTAYMQLYIGLMSGTSMDGIDGVLMDFGPSAHFRILAHQHEPFDPALRQALFDLNHSGNDEVHRAALASNALSRAYAKVVGRLCADLGLESVSIRAVGAHGQTVRHRPGEFDATGYTSQLLNGALLAELTGVDVVCDFRSRDVAAGGQGAPLVPAFHRAAFALPGQDMAVLNLGGIGNITFLHADGRTSGHDCGPGNVLLDLWCTRHTGKPYDDNGDWAARGQASHDLLQHLMREPYLSRLPPKSSGRDLFNATWLDAQLKTAPATAQSLTAEDVQATLGIFTVTAAVQDLHRDMPRLRKLLICGGGALNHFLLSAFQRALPAVQVLPVQQASALRPMEVEAAAFAWLAHCFVNRWPSNCSAVTGAQGNRILGCQYPA